MSALHFTILIVAALAALYLLIGKVGP